MLAVDLREGLQVPLALVNDVEVVLYYQVPVSDADAREDFSGPGRGNRGVVLRSDERRAKRAVLEVEIAHKLVASLLVA